MTVHVTATPAAFDTTRMRVGPYDRLLSGTVGYRLMQDYGDAILCHIDDGTDRAVQFTQVQLRSMVARGELHIDRDWYHPHRDAKVEEEDHLLLDKLSPREQAILAWRSALTDAVEDLVREGKLKLTDDDIAANMDMIIGRAQTMMGPHADRRREHPVRALDENNRPAPGTLRKWVSKRRKRGLVGICPAFGNRGGPGMPLNPQIQKIMWQEIQGYLVLNGPSKTVIWQRVARRVDKLNKQRAVAGLEMLKRPSRTTVSNAIGKLDAFQVMVAREGEERARKEFRPVLEGIRAERPLEIVMMDTHTLDLWTLIEENNWHDKLSPELLKTIRKNKGKHRFKLTFAICAATRVIVGMTVSLSENTPAALHTLAMVLSDKGVWADCVGALRPWNMYGRPEEVLTDAGSAFTSEIFRHACLDLGIAPRRAMAGKPEMRGIGERIFRTVNTGLCARLAGNTFHELVSQDQPDDLPTGFKTAALTIEDLVFAIVRWVVDVYHHSPHEGLLGATPADEWRRRVAEYGVMPPPDRARMRMAFGTRIRRTLSKAGVTVLGVRYHSAQLAAHMHKHGRRKVDVRWHPSDIGMVAVRTEAGWIDVPSVQPEFEGRRADTWLTAAKHVRPGRAKAKEIDLRVALEALEAIEAPSNDARLTAGITVDPWDEGRLASAESRVFAGVTWRETGSAVEDRPCDGFIGEAIGDPIDPPRLPDAVEVAPTAPAPVAAPTPGTAPETEPTEPTRATRRDGSTLRIEED
ncbi:Mu transposase C-terminal domain-containing protein [Jannaschia aquimarina]|uniref:Integrase core domain protein n=1 Tax=Jannaschia aquimarina TaxID=935700 RepID=A0A0D1CLA3_9RHOB|nr:Mu transposase C-terminal domain-containing protein [Jannaschia aquimarina]KIT15592.1 Integrase core domain protein [Jannaschia aquimarina]SNT27405.1 putative transposase [Jannaschia aquimarina]